MLRRSIAMAAMGMLVSAACAAEPIDLQKLQQLIPDKLDGIARTAIGAQVIKLDQIDLAQATAEFDSQPGDENAPRIFVEIVDYRADKSIASSARAWRKLKIDKQTDVGYERTIDVDGEPACEMYQPGMRSGQVHILVAGRFYVNIQTAHIAPERLKSIAASLPIKSLAQLK